MAPPDVYLIKMADTAITRGHRDVFELDIHIVLGYVWISIEARCCGRLVESFDSGDMATFDELATIDLARSYFEGYDMILGRGYQLVSIPQWDRIWKLPGPR